MYKEQITAYMESKKEEMLSDLSMLVKIDSQRMEPSEGKPFGEGPARVLQEAGKLLEGYGLRVTNYDNYVITGDFGPGEKALDILAHLDVVPVSPDDWTVTAPFTPLIRDGRIYGRGTCDDKGPAIAALYAIRCIKDLGLPIRKGVRLILGSDEECGSGDLEYYYAREKEAPYSFTPDADFPLINLEKARLEKTFFAPPQEGGKGARVVCLEAGSKVNVVPPKAKATFAGLSAYDLKAAAKEAADRTKAEFLVIPAEGKEGEVTVQVRGLSAHGSLPELGNNALTALLDLIDHLALADTATTHQLKALAKLFPHGETDGKTLGIAMQESRSGALSMNFGILRLNEKGLYGELDSRAPLGADDTNVTGPVNAKLQEAGLTPDDKTIRPPHYVPEDSFFVRTLLEVYEEHTGKAGKALYTGGGTYVHELERGVAFGCMVEGVDNHMHGDDEFMEIDNLLLSARIFADAILRICQ